MTRLIFSFVFPVLMASFLLSSCGVVMPFINSKDKLANLKIGMNNIQVEDLLGGPDEVRSKKGGVHVYTIWEYDMFRKSDAWKNMAWGIPTITLSWWFEDLMGYDTPYLIRFVDGKVEKWGKSGDWQYY